MSKNTETYEDQVRKEFESTQEPEVNEPVKDLGKVKLDQDLEDPEIKRIKSSMDYVNIPLETLPSQGRFYPEGTRISIRAARVGEIREFSIINEEDPKDIRDKMTYIVSQCTKVYYGNNLGYYKDLLEDVANELIGIDELAALQVIANVMERSGESSWGRYQIGSWKAR